MSNLTSNQTHVDKCSPSSSSGSSTSSPHPLPDPSRDYLSLLKSNVDKLFKPKTVVVVGATDRKESVGRVCLENLIKANEKKKKLRLFGVNPKKKDVLGVSCYPRILDIPFKIDLAIIITPNYTVCDIVEQCGVKGVKGVIIITAGFREIGPEGVEMDERIVELTTKYGIRLIGPNCLGLIDTHHGLNATFADTMASEGSICFMSQSGAMCTAVLDWAVRESVGFSAFISVGSMSGISWGELIDYFGNDSRTSSIVIYMETIGNPQSFLSAAKTLTLTKPIIVIKAGKSIEAAKAASSHTGSMVGAHDAFCAAMKRVGVVVVDTVEELFDCAHVLSMQPRINGPRLLIITNAGGPGVLATDAAVNSGCKILDLNKDLTEALNNILPSAWSKNNPVDILGDALPETYEHVLEVVSRYRSEYDAILIILSPQKMTKPLETAKRILSWYRTHTDNVTEWKIPILASWMGGYAVLEGRRELNLGGIPAFEYPDSAADIIGRIWQQSRDLQLLNEYPSIHTEPSPSNVSGNRAMGIISDALKENRLILTETESKSVLMDFGISIADSISCTTSEDAVSAATRIGYPVVVKLNSSTLTHKTDVGGVKLNLNSDDAVRKAFLEIRTSVSKIDPSHFEGVSVQPQLNTANGIEVIMGSFEDVQFGPLVVFGAGGSLVEIFKDTSLTIPPLNPTVAIRKMEETKIFQAIQGVGSRFKPLNVDLLVKTFVYFSQMVCRLSDYVKEIDINPVLVEEDRVTALDARFILHEPEHKSVPLAIRPYPSEYSVKVTLKNNDNVTLRAAYSGDFERFSIFHRALSANTVRQRYCRDVSIEERLSVQRQTAVCYADYNRLIALIAVRDDGEMIGIGRLIRYPITTDVVEYKLAILDKYQGLGLGTIMTNHAVNYIAPAENYRIIRSVILNENLQMNELLLKEGFEMHAVKKDDNLLLCIKNINSNPK